MFKTNKEMQKIREHRLVKEKIGIVKYTIRNSNRKLKKSM